MYVLAECNTNMNRFTSDTIELLSPHQYVFGRLFGVRHFFRSSREFAAEGISSERRFSMVKNTSLF